MRIETDIHQIALTDIKGHKTTLAEYSGKVLLIVNVASKCGFTSQYHGLQKLHENYHERGLVVCGFPSNDFRKQEPGSEDEISDFCRINYGVTFPMFSKIHVRGKATHPLFKKLVEHPHYGGSVKWNFSKFLVDRNGELKNRFAPFTKPTSKRITKAIEKSIG